MREKCALDTLLSAGGPVRVTVRPCCLAALVGRRRPSPDAAAEDDTVADRAPVGRARPQPDEDAVGPALMGGHWPLPGEAAFADSELVCAAAEIEMPVSP